jgi:hypothetical protein
MELWTDTCTAGKQWIHIEVYWNLSSLASRNTFGRPFHQSLTLTSFLPWLLTLSTWTHVPSAQAMTILPCFRNSLAVPGSAAAV